MSELKKLRAQLAAKTNECVALALGVENFKIIQDQAEVIIDATTVGEIPKGLWDIYHKAKEARFLSASATAKQLIEDHDRKVRIKVMGKAISIVKCREQATSEEAERVEQSSESEWTNAGAKADTLASLGHVGMELLLLLKDFEAAAQKEGG